MKVLVVCGALVAVSLHGCGNNSGTSTAPGTTQKPGNTTTTTGTTTTTTSVAPGPPPPPRDGKAVADLMNKEYYGYVKGDKTSSFGNCVRIAHDINIFCGTGCFDGEPDCRVSTSIFNSQMMIDPYNHWQASGWFGYRNGQGMSGLYFNSTLVLSKLGKCTYAWDGATTGKVNGGCGCAQGVTSPDACNFTLHPDAPYWNKVPPSYTQNCTGDSPNVKACWCKDYTGNQPADGNGNQCFWKGVAFDTTQDEDTEDETHTMLDWRVDNTANNSAGPYGPAVLAWNEMVLDGGRVLEALKMDPAGTIVAIVYTPGNGGQDTQKNVAQKMATDMQTKFKLSKPIPVIMLDQSVDTQTPGSEPVWVYRADDQPTNIAVV